MDVRAETDDDTANCQRHAPPSPGSSNLLHIAKRSSRAQEMKSRYQQIVPRGKGGEVFKTQASAPAFRSPDAGDSSLPAYLPRTQLTLRHGRRR